MAAPKDLTGQHFGRLTVLGLDPEPYRSPAGKTTRRWRCRCDCGKELSVLTNALTGKSGTRSCGCARAEKTRKQASDLTGQRFGRLTVLRATDLPKPEPNGTRLGWLCRCDCGKEIVATSKSLHSGKLLSCGCLLSEIGRKKIKAQNVVGHYQGTTVTAIRPERKPNRNNTSGVKGVYWSEREQRWIAKICVKGKNITLGRFATKGPAIRARLAAEEQYFGPILEAYDAEHKTPPSP